MSYGILNFESLGHCLQIDDLDELELLDCTSLLLVPMQSVFEFIDCSQYPMAFRRLARKTTKQHEECSIRKGYGPPGPGLYPCDDRYIPVCLL